MSRARAHRVTALLVGGLVVLAQFPATQPARAAEPAGDLSFAVDASEAQESSVAELIVVRTNGDVGAVSVDVSVSGGSATETDDFDGGSVTLAWDDGDAASKSVLVTLAEDGVAEGPETVQLTLSNATGGASVIAPATTTLTITDSVPNQPPVATDVFTLTPQEAPVTFSLEATDPDGDPLSYDPDEPTNGSVICTLEVCTYTPDDGFFGVDTFTYVANDGASDSNVATVSVTVSENVAVEAFDDGFTVLSGMTTTLDVTINDIDWDRRGLTVTSTSEPSHGDVSCSGPTCDYTPDAAYLGPDAFTYTVEDINGDTDSASVSIQVVKCTSTAGACIDNGTIRLGVRPEGHLNVPGGSPSTGGTTSVGLRYLVTGNEAIAPGCECEGWGAADAITGTTGYANASTDNGANNLTVESFVSTGTTAVSIVTVDDVLRVTHDYHPSTQTPNLYEVSVSVENISAEPVDLRYRRVMDWDVEPTAFLEFVTSNVGTSPSVIANTNDGFSSADPLAPTTVGLVAELKTGNFTDAGPADHGALFDFGFGMLAPGASRDFTIWYGAAADEAGAMLALARAHAQVYSLGQPSTEDGPSLGTPNTFIFGFSGVGGAPENNDPTAIDDALDPGTPEDTPRLIAASELLGNDNDVDGDTPVVSAVSAGTNTHGAVLLNADGTVTYTPAADSFGPATFTYTISDGHGGTDAATVTLNVTPVNDVPVADDQSLTTPFGAALALTLGASDADGDGLTFSVDTEPAKGTVDCTAADCTYTPDAGFSGSDSFTFTASDGTASDSGTISITVAENGAPVALDDEDDLLEDTPAPLNLLGNDTDPDGDGLTIIRTTTPAHGTISCASHPCTYTPDANYFGPDGFSYTMGDGRGGSDTATVTLEIAPLNDAPTAEDVSATDVAQGSQGIITLTGHDIDGGSLTFEVLTSPAQGSLGAVSSVSCAPAGGGATCTATVTFSADEGAVGTDGFTYRASDGSLHSEAATVSIGFAASPDPTVGIAGTSVVEGTGPNFTAIAFSVTLSRATAHDVTVGYATSPGTASAGSDYGTATGTATIPAGATGTTITLQVVADALDEPHETFDVTLSAPVGATLDSARTTATGTITDDDDCTIVGTSGPDNLVGTPGADVICALAGDDTINGLGGDDVLRGGDGTDLVTFFNAPNGVAVDLAAGTAFGWGTDALSSIESIIGSGHADRLSGDGAANVISGLGGADEIAGGEGADELAGNDGDDALIGGGGDDALLGGSGSDTADFSRAPGGVTVDLARNRSTGWGNDRLSLIENASGSLFADTLIGSAGPNALSGDAGNDTLVGGAGDDELRGGDGTDTADFHDSRGPVSVNLRIRAATGDGTDIVEDVENVIGTDRDDTLVGHDGANVLSGLGGDDSITGWFGNDDLRGGTGEDTVLYDAIVAGAGPMTINLGSGAAAGAWGSDSLSLFENAFGTAFADSMIGSDGDNVLHGGPGSDTIDGLGGDDAIFGGDGNDTLLGGDGRDAMNGEEGSDEISGEGGSDEISGQDGNDAMSGGAGNDSLSGGNGQDSILGNDGNDSLVGGPGALPDALNGGAGHDSCSESADIKLSCEKP